jgi:predicted nucleic acid-binding protein
VSNGRHPVYLDTNIFIFALEAEPVFGPACSKLLHAVDTGEILAVTSELTLAEVLVKPLQAGNAELAKRFSSIVAESRLGLRPVSRSILYRSAEIRALHGGRLADAIHVATAVEAGCGFIVSEDLRIRTPPGLERVSAIGLGLEPDTTP